jgi:YD repeat-containing protein
MPKKTRTEYTVVGTRPFPIDMLRYDCAWPTSSQDAQKIADTFDWDSRGQMVEIKLSTDYQFAPEHRRWESFGWRVKP